MIHLLQLCIALGGDYTHQQWCRHHLPSGTFLRQIFCQHRWWQPAESSTSPNGRRHAEWKGFSRTQELHLDSPEMAQHLQIEKAADPGLPSSSTIECCCGTRLQCQSASSTSVWQLDFFRRGRSTTDQIHLAEVCQNATRHCLRNVMNRWCQIVVET